jgi:hypothetical protein
VEVSAGDGAADAAGDAPGLGEGSGLLLTATQNMVSPFFRCWATSSPCVMSAKTLYTGDCGLARPEVLSPVLMKNWLPLIPVAVDRAIAKVPVLYGPLGPSSARL